MKTFTVTFKNGDVKRVTALVCKTFVDSYAFFSDEGQTRLVASYKVSTVASIEDDSVKSSPGEPSTPSSPTPMTPSSSPASPSKPETSPATAPSSPTIPTPSVTPPTAKSDAK